MNQPSLIPTTSNRLRQRLSGLPALRFAVGPAARPALSALALLFALTACNEATQPASGQSAVEQSTAAQPATEEMQSETERLNAWFDAKYEEQLQFSPIQMTFLGRK